MKKKIVFSAVIILLILVIISLLFFRRTEFNYSGVMEAVEINLPSRLNDTIAKLYADEGDNVTKGQLLAELECKEVNLTEEISQKEFKRAEDLLKTTAGSKENYDLKKHNYDQAALHKTWCKILSSIDGKVLYKYYEEGEFAATGRKVFTVADLSRIDAWVYVEHDEAALLKPGMKVKGLLPVRGALLEDGQNFEGIILTINDEAEFTPKNVQTRKERARLVYGVKTRFENDSNLTLKPGMTLEVTFPEKLK